MKLLFLSIHPMRLNTLTAISPVDGRYFTATKTLAPYFSEFGLIKYRIRVECEYFIALCGLLPELSGVPKALPSKLRRLHKSFSEKDAAGIKEIEKVTNHDVKAVEYFLKEKLKEFKGQRFAEFIHFGLTSQDINNTAIPLMLKDFIEGEYLPLINKLRELMDTKALKWKVLPMLARTHGQPASPTRLGKEIAVFVERIDRQLELLATVPFSAKFGGSTGNFNAHHFAYPGINWNKFATDFLRNLGLVRSYPTTQIEHYDNLAALFDNLKRLNTILIDFSKDMWLYIALNYFDQKIRKNEVGSSAMPHKINPIDFENAEGNLGFANAIFEYMASKLPISRLQRDLTDSTVLRNTGIPLAHTVIAIKSLQAAVSKIEANREALHSDLAQNWAVVSEAVQTLLRKEGFSQPYELLKEMTRTNNKVTQEEFVAFINTLDVNDRVRKKLFSITPFNFTGK